MKKFYFFVALLLNFSAFSQEDAWVYFVDKPDAQTYIDNPLTMLTQRALDRRAAHGVTITVQDAPVYQLYINQITAAPGITVKAKSKWMNALHIRGSQIDIENLENLPFVDHVYFANRSLNVGGKVAQTNTVSLLNKVLETQADFNYGTSTTQIQMLNGHFLHQQDFTGQGKIIAVIDAGFPGVDTQAPFQRLRDNNLILGGYDFVNRTNNPYTGFQHGTQVLSNMGGFVDGQLVGTAPDAQYYLFITEDISGENPVEESYWVEAVEEADRLGVDVINTSLGYFTYQNPNYSYTYADLNGQTAFSSKAADIAFSKGMLLVTSAGNSGSTSDPHIGVPGDAVNTLTIGAVNNSEVKAGFSSIGPTADNRIKPDLMAMGVGATVATQTGSITTNNGTSFAGPILAGAVTSFWSAFPNKTNAEIVALVRASADRFSNPDNNYGYGIPDFQSAYNTALLSSTDFLSKNFIVYPNPVQNYLSVEFPENLNATKIEMFNTLGQNVLVQNVDNGAKISLDKLNSGLYIYKITSGSLSSTGKLIKK
ncbi:S8 family serine peptidase [Flavobacterium sp.]|uniref:S8 family serine peptidase n=1 Tax=Flavobacterium sp. TaxID=239 RepID=UPI0028BEF693|nr:S8 family serine peptidase [Flavobacterium sp.]